jgi:hypothetical protein
MLNLKSFLNFLHLTNVVLLLRFKKEMICISFINNVENHNREIVVVKT